TINVTERGTAVNISGVTIRKGGGVRNGGALTISDSAVSGNRMASITDWDRHVSSEVSGGGIANTGILTITGSTISDNALEGGYYGGTVFGGGIVNQGTLTLTNSEVRGNTIQNYNRFSPISALGAGID